MRIVAFILLLGFSFTANGQQSSGTIEYSRNQSWVNIMSKMPYMTKDEIERRKLTWGKRQRGGESYILYFNSDNSLYTHNEVENTSGYSRRQDDFVIIRDYAEKTCHDQVDFLGKTYIVNEDLPRIKWKILNEIKEIAGYLCMKAETIDPVKGIKIHAWFSDEIQIFGGPEGYYGLPGMILAMEFNEDDVIIEATKVTFSDEQIELPIPKKMKGKSISVAELDAKKVKYITEAIEGRRNPYWQMRY